MTEQQSEPNPDDFFQEEAPTPEKNINTDKKAMAEDDELFSGNMDDIEVWLKYKKFKIHKENEDSERDLREKNARKAYKFSRNWAIFIAVLILIYGFTPRECFKLSQTEFMFVIGSLTASILTYYLYVIKYLFYRPNKQEEQK